MFTDSLWSLAGALLFTAFGIVVLFATWHSAREWGWISLLNACGKTAHARIIDYRGTFNRYVSYFVTYRFNVVNAKHKKVSYEKEQQISSRHMQCMRKDTQVDVIYLPRNPHISRLSGEHTDNTARDMSTIIVVVATIIFPYIALAWIGVFLITRFGYKLMKN